MRRALLALTASFALLGCPDPNKPEVEHPKVGNIIDPSAQQTSVLTGNNEPLVVDWAATARGNLETTMHDGLAIVSFTPQGLRVLSGCHVDGNYGFIGMAMKQQVVRLENEQEIKANLPLGGLGLAAQFGGEFQRGAVLDVALVMVGKMRTTWRSVARKDLQGDCAGATHFVRGALVGAFAMDKGQKSQARAAAQIFGFGANGGTRSSEGLHQTDGRLEDCQKASPELPAPPGQCAALVRLDLQEIAQDEKRADVKAQPSATTGDAVETTKCPSGMVSVDGKCAEKGSTTTAYECTGERADECYSQCEKGNLPSCTKRAQMGLTGVNGATKEPLAAAKLLAVACKAGHARGCGILGAVFLDPKLVQTPDPKGAFDLFQRACNAGDEFGCYGVGGSYLFGRGVAKDQRSAVNALAKSCSGGWDAGCSDLGVLFLGGNGLARDDVKAATLFKRACDGKNATGCGNLGYMVETGTGVSKDIKLAAQLYEKACNTDDESCSSVAVLFQLGKGEPKNDGAVVKLHQKACTAGSVISCAFLKSYVDPRVTLDLENAKNAMSVWQGTCSNGIVRDCTQAAVIALSVGLKDQGSLLMKKACQLGDDWACANDKLVIKAQ